MTRDIKIENVGTGVIFEGIGEEGVAPSEKRMRCDKFTTF